VQKFALTIGAVCILYALDLSSKTFLPPSKSSTLGGYSQTRLLVNGSKCPEHDCAVRSSGGVRTAGRARMTRRVIGAHHWQENPLSSADELNLFRTSRMRRAPNRGMDAILKVPAKVSAAQLYWFGPRRFCRAGMWSRGVRIAMPGTQWRTSGPPRRQNQPLMQ